MQADRQDDVAAQGVSQQNDQDQDQDQYQMQQQQHDPANVDNLQQQQDYGDEDGDGQQDPEEMGMYGSVSNALAGQRASKKRAEDDVKLLANRLALLKLEEKKVSLFGLNFDTLNCGSQCELGHYTLCFDSNQCLC